MLSHSGQFSTDDSRASLAGHKGGVISKRGVGLKGALERHATSKGKAELIQKLEDDGCSPGEGSKIEIIIAKLYQMAKNGDIQAIKLYLAYLEGLPTAKLEHITGGSDSLNQIAEKLLNEHTPEEIVDIVKYKLD